MPATALGRASGAGARGGGSGERERRMGAWQRAWQVEACERRRGTRRWLRGARAARGWRGRVAHATAGGARGRLPVPAERGRSWGERKEKERRGRES